MIPFLTLTKLALICPNNQFLKYSTTNRDDRESKSNKNECVIYQFSSKYTYSKNHIKVKINMYEINIYYKVKVYLVL